MIEPAAIYASKVGATGAVATAVGVWGAVEFEPLAVGGSVAGLVALVIKVVTDGRREAEIRNTYQALVADLRDQLDTERTRGSELLARATAAEMHADQLRLDLTAERAGRLADQDTHARSLAAMSARIAQLEGTT